MPKGVPVATVAIDNAANAAVLAVQCLALSDLRLQRALADHKRKLAASTRTADQKLPR
jgi:5-(carboxyamino)imidazole ribonucleotide mutase